jgi:hypothetical protein
VDNLSDMYRQLLNSVISVGATGNDSVEVLRDRRIVKSIPDKLFHAKSAIR